uniref:Putative secreted protein n=1 Tax=Anopheles triannulatus TaxID=58253 RepID=A0A2M4B7A1_9DIPT
MLMTLAMGVFVTRAAELRAQSTDDACLSCTGSLEFQLCVQMQHGIVIHCSQRGADSQSASFNSPAEVLRTVAYDDPLVLR